MQVTTLSSSPRVASCPHVMLALLVASLLTPALGRRCVPSPLPGSSFSSRSSLSPTCRRVATMNSNQIAGREISSAAIPSGHPLLQSTNEGGRSYLGEGTPVVVPLPLTPFGSTCASSASDHLACMSFSSWKRIANCTLYLLCFLENLAYHKRQLLLVAGFSLLVVAESLLSSREDDTRS
jgi:hypothetical protein